MQRIFKHSAQSIKQNSQYYFSRHAFENSRNDVPENSEPIEHVALQRQPTQKI